MRVDFFYLKALMCVVLLTGVNWPSHAALGGQLESVASDASRMHAQRLVQRTDLATPTGTSFTRHEIILADGGTAVEFVDTQGRVFAVRWNAPTMPDLDTLLGAFKVDMDRAQAAGHRPDAGRVRSSRSLRTSSGGWTLVSTGHLRAFRGMSYLEAWLPMGFDLKELEK